MDIHSVEIIWGRLLKLLMCEKDITNFYRTTIFYSFVYLYISLYLELPRSCTNSGYLLYRMFKIGVKRMSSCRIVMCFSNVTNNIPWNYWKWKHRYRSRNFESLAKAANVFKTNGGNSHVVFYSLFSSTQCTVSRALMSEQSTSLAVFLRNSPASIAHIRTHTISTNTRTCALPRSPSLSSRPRLVRWP